MLRPPPHLALFSLVPFEGNERAKLAIAHPSNARYLSTLPDGKEGLDVGFHFRSKSCTTLATLGRGVEADIYVEGSNIAKLQCSFELDLGTGVVMFYDRSHGCTTQVFGKNAMPFEYQRTRKVLVQKGLNNIIGMGGERCNLYQFELKWHHDPIERGNAIENYDAQQPSWGQEENTRLAQTMGEAPTDLPSRRNTRPHTPGSTLRMRYLKVGNKLGSGQFGSVYKAIDVDSGRLMAIKILEQPVRASQQKDWKISLLYAMKREVEILSNISHVSNNRTISMILTCI